MSEIQDSGAETPGLKALPKSGVEIHWSWKINQYTKNSKVRSAQKNKRLVSKFFTVFSAIILSFSFFVPSVQAQIRPTQTALLENDVTGNVTLNNNRCKLAKLKKQIVITRPGDQWRFDNYSSCTVWVIVEVGKYEVPPSISICDQRPIPNVCLETIYRRATKILPMGTIMTPWFSYEQGYKFALKAFTLTKAKYGR